MSLDLHNIRQEYSKKELSPEECLPDAVAQFEVWLQEALHSEVHEPTAVNVATVDENGRPTARIVLLKGVENGKLVFFTNYESRKGQAIAHCPYIAMTFFWPELERQVRIEGRIQKIDDARSDAYFASRPYTSRVGAWASRQSQPIHSKAELLAKAAFYGARYPLGVPRPPHWGGYEVSADRVEFWQGRPSRLHDRVLYVYNESSQAWDRSRLAP